MTTTAPPRATEASTRLRGSWRTSLRIARREVRRAKGRSALIASMIGVPILLIAGLAVTNETALSEDPAERALRQLGAADALITLDGRTPVVQDPYGDQVFPASSAASDPDAAPWTPAEVARATGAEVTPLRTGSTLVRTERGALSASIRELDIRRPVTAGLGEVTEGRAPEADDEVLVSQSLADRGFGPGTEVALGTDGTPVAEVTGVVRNPADLHGRQLVALPGAVLGDDADEVYLVDTDGAAVDWSTVRALNQQGLGVISRAVVTDPPPDDQLPARIRESMAGSGSLVGFYVLVVAIIILEVVLLCGPAFAVGARRQSRDLALLVATGATSRDVRRVVLAQALVLGLGSALGGAALGVAAVAAGRPLLESVVGREVGGIEVPVPALAGLVAVGTLAAVVSAYVPSRQAAQQDPVTTLAGRRGEVAARRGWPIVGLALIAGAWLLIVVQPVAVMSEMSVVFGMVTLVLGAILLTPAVIDVVGRLGGRIPLSLRLATRDAARNRSRTTPAVAAIMGAVAGVTALAIGSASDFAQDRRDYEPRAPAGTLLIDLAGDEDRPSAVETLADQIREELSDHTVHLVQTAGSYDQGFSVLEPSCTPLRAERCQFDPSFAEAGLTAVSSSSRYGSILVAEPDLVELLAGEPLSKLQRRSLAGGGALVPDDAAIGTDGMVQISTHTGEVRLEDQRVLTVPAVPLPPERDGTHVTYLADVVLTPDTMDELEIAATPSQILVPPEPSAIDEEQEERIAELAQGTAAGSRVYVERGFTDTYTVQFLALSIVGGLIVLVGTATATALALTDARPDFATLGAVGAAPRTRRRAAMAQAAVIAGLGALFGIAVGVGPGIAVTYPLTEAGTSGHVVEIPWSLLGVVVLAVPLIAVLGTGLLTRSRLPMVERVE